MSSQQKVFFNRDAFTAIFFLKDAFDKRSIDQILNSFSKVSNRTKHTVS